MGGRGRRGREEKEKVAAPRKQENEVFFKTKRKKGGEKKGKIKLGRGSWFEKQGWICTHKQFTLFAFVEFV